MPRKKISENVKRIVVKIGSSSITNDDGVSRDKINSFVSQISDIVNEGYEVILVTSGAVSAGLGKINSDKSNMTIPMRQALAAIGQTVLMNEYRSAFIEKGLNIAQILMTEDDVNNRKRFLNIKNTIECLLENNIVPVVNENDTVVVTEIKFGDNDTLSAHVANLTDADLLILLSDVDGFFNDLSDNKPIDVITEIDEELMNKAGGTGSKHGTGGMVTKLKAADMVMKCGQIMAIANASEKEILKKILHGEKKGTIFFKNKKKIPARKKWIYFNLKTMGRVVIDSGAEKAIVDNKKSLLAIGIVSVIGNFNSGDAVEVVNKNEIVLCKGISNYSSNEIKIIKGRKTSEIRAILKDNYYDEVIHRDNMSMSE